MLMKLIQCFSRLRLARLNDEMRESDEISRGKLSKTNMDIVASEVHTNVFKFVSYFHSLAKLVY